jgi:O-antigen/teichoic acid export membrane protein
MPSIFTFVFWLLTARLAGAEAIGLVSAAASFVIIIVTIDILNMSLGMKRHLGIAVSIGDYGNFKQILASTTLFVGIMVIISTVILALPNLQVLEILNIDRQYIWIIIPMIAALALQQVFSEALIAALQSKKLVIPLLVGLLCRFPLLFGVIYFFNAPSMGTLLSYSSFLFISTAWYSVYLIKILRKTPSRATENILHNIKHILTAGLASWVPHIISVLGSQLAIITVFSLEGSIEGGKFYLPMAIYTVTLFIVIGINRVSHPLVAGMSTKNQQTAYLSYSMKIAFMFTMPIAASLLFFPEKFLSLVGREFGSAGDTLAIFMLSVPFSIISEMVFYFIYGRGDNRTVLYLGLAGNIPKIILYFLIVPVFGANGAALAYLIGSLAALVFSLKVIKVHSLVVHYTNCMILTGIPLAIGIVTWLLDIQFLLSSAIILFGSLLAYVKIRLFTDADLQNILYAGLPRNTAEKIYPTLSKIIDRID